MGHRVCHQWFALNIKITKLLSVCLKSVPNRVFVGGIPSEVSV